MAGAYALPPGWTNVPLRPDVFIHDVVAPLQQIDHNTMAAPYYHCPTMVCEAVRQRLAAEINQGIMPQTEFLPAAPGVQNDTAPQAKLIQIAPSLGYAQDTINVRISQLSGVVWCELTACNFETIASILDRCPQPKRRWEGDRTMEYKLVLGTRELRGSEIIGDLLNEVEDIDGPGREVEFTLCVEPLRTAQLRLRNKKLPKPDRA